MARRKPSPHIVKSREAAEGTMAELAAISRKLTVLTAEMNEEIAAAKAKYDKASLPLIARREELEGGLAAFAILNREELFADGRKSLDLGFGIIGFRLSTSIVQKSGITSEMTLEKLRQFKMLEGIRTKESVNKDAMADWTDERLATVGLCRRKTDSFFWEAKEEDLPSV